MISLRFQCIWPLWCIRSLRGQSWWHNFMETPNEHPAKAELFSWHYCVLAKAPISPNFCMRAQWSHLHIRHLKDLVLCRLKWSRAEESSNFLYVLIVPTSTELVLDTFYVSCLLGGTISCLFSKYQTICGPPWETIVNLGRPGFKRIFPSLEDKTNLLANGGRGVIQDPKTNVHHVDLRSLVCTYQQCMSSSVVGFVWTMETTEHLA
jgi:hypothetical protein